MKPQRQAASQAVAAELPRWARTLKHPGATPD
jgi:hypothetical protein